MATLSEVDRFAGFFGKLGYKLGPFQRKIVEEVFSPRRETLILLPRANGKSTLLASYKRNAAAAGTLHEIVSHGRLRHGGADLPRQHALAAEIRSRELGEVISKTRSREHIDCLMALCYAADMAAALKPKRQSIYETRNLAGA